MAGGSAPGDHDHDQLLTRGAMNEAKRGGDPSEVILQTSGTAKAAHAAYELSISRRREWAADAAGSVCR